MTRMSIVTLWVASPNCWAAVFSCPCELSYNIQVIVFSFCCRLPCLTTTTTISFLSPTAGHGVTGDTAAQMWNNHQALMGLLAHFFFFFLVPVFIKRFFSVQQSKINLVTIWRVNVALFPGCHGLGMSNWGRLIPERVASSLYRPFTDSHIH